MAFLIGTDPGLRQTRTPSTDNFTHGVGFTANSSTTIVLSQDPGNENHLDINFDGIEQHRDTYTVSGTTVTFDAVIPTGVVNIQATYAVTVASLTVPDSSVSTAKIVDANVTTSKILDANITTSKIQDNAVSLDKMAHGLDGNLITFDANGAPEYVATGSANQVLTSAGAGAPPVFADAGGGITSSSVFDLTASANSSTFSFSPSSSAKRITVLICGLSTDDTNAFKCEFGDSGGIETTGYHSMHTRLRSGVHPSINPENAVNATTGANFRVYRHSAAGTLIGRMIFNLQDASANRWNVNWWTADDSQFNDTYIGIGDKALSGVLTTIKITAQQGFDAGTVSFMEE